MTEVYRGINVGLVGVIRMSLVQILRELWIAEEMTDILYRVVIQKPYFTKKKTVFPLSKSIIRSKWTIAPIIKV